MEGPRGPVPPRGGDPRRKDRRADPRLRPDPRAARTPFRRGRACRWCNRRGTSCRRGGSRCPAAGRARIGHEAVALYRQPKRDRSPAPGRCGPFTRRFSDCSRPSGSWTTCPTTTELATAAGRKRLAAAARVLLEKNRAVPLVERWYRTLRDDSAGTARWLEAASGIVQPAGRGAPNVGYLTVRRPGQPQPKAMTGEPLRGSAATRASRNCWRLGVWRLPERARPGRSPTCSCSSACDLALRFTWWDEVEVAPHDQNADDDLPRSIARPRAGVAVRRLRPLHRGVHDRPRGRGNRAALDEYAEWVQTIEPRTIEHTWREVLEPLWTYPEHPAIAEAARAMFVDPKSRWLPLMPVEREPARPSIRRAACFAAGVRARVSRGPARGPGRSDRRSGRRCEQPEGAVQYTLADGRSEGFLDVRVPDPARQPGVEVPIRTCDYVAWKLSALDGAPECLLTWPEARRDDAVAACAAFLQRYGGRLAAVYPPDEPGARRSDRPAAASRPSTTRPRPTTSASGTRRVFAGRGGKARVVALPSGYPVRARWLALKSFPVDRRFQHGPLTRRFPPGRLGLADGGGAQGRPPGAVLRFRRSRRQLPASRPSEIEFLPDGRRRLTHSPSGLAARLETAEPPDRRVSAGPADSRHAAALQRARGRAVGADGVHSRRGRRQAGAAPGGIAGPERVPQRPSGPTMPGAIAAAAKKTYADGRVRPRQRLSDAGADRNPSKRCGSTSTTGMPGCNLAVTGSI